MDEAGRAVSEAQGFFLAGRMVAFLAQSSSTRRRGRAGIAYEDAEFGEVLDGVRHLRGATSLEPGEEGSRLDAVKLALAELRGNRTRMASRLEGDELVAKDVRPGPRWAARDLLGLVGTCRESVLLERFDRLIAEHPGSGLPLCHRGELCSWLGHYEAARHDLERVVERFPHVRWATIGLATLETIEGNHERALEVLAVGVRRMDDTTGPGVFGVRGEALRRLGRTSEAIVSLEQARALRPRRITAWVNLALAYDAAGRTGDARRAFAEVMSRAYPYLHDAASVLSASVEDTGASRAILEQALSNALGNRSASVLTWKVGASPLRCLTGSADVATVQAMRERELAGARAELSRPSRPRA